MKKKLVISIIAVMFFAVIPILFVTAESVEEFSKMRAEIDEEVLIAQAEEVLRENALAVQSIRKYENAQDHRSRISKKIEEKIQIPYHEWPVSVRYCTDKYFYDNGWGFLYPNEIPAFPGEGDTTEQEAILIAHDFLIEHDLATELELETYGVHRIFYFNTLRKRNEWGISYYLETPEDEEFPRTLQFYVRVISETGEVDSSILQESNG